MNAVGFRIDENEKGNSKYTQHWCKENTTASTIIPALQSEKGNIITNCRSVMFDSEDKLCLLKVNVEFTFHVSCTYKAQT